MEQNQQSTIVPGQNRLDGIPRELVHKLDPGQVLPIGWQQSVPGAHSIDVRWPTRHSFYAPYRGLGDPLLIVEAIRQSSVLIAHAGYAVPLDDQLVWRGFAFTSSLEGLRRLSGHEERYGGMGRRTRIEAVCFETVRRRDGGVGGLGLSFSVLCDGEVVAAGWTRFSVLSPRVYRRLRGERADRRFPLPGAPSHSPTPDHPSSPLRADRVGRQRRGDVLLSRADGEDGWRLRVDPGHPILFDHAVDHVPGTVLLDGIRQAAHAAAWPEPVVPVAMECAFERYVEFDETCLVRAEPAQIAADGGSRLRVTVHQGQGAPACVAEVCVAPIGHRIDPVLDRGRPVARAAGVLIPACPSLVSRAACL